ncbi:MAG: hypothetical protein AB8G86_21880 [Saprospiraceae bacterium]
MPIKNVSLYAPTKVFFILSLSFLLYNCEKQIEEINYYSNVDERLHPYFKKFEQEGKKRGLIIDLEKSNIYGSIERIQNNGIVGLCGNNEKVVIDDNFWARSSHYSKELVVFHELGHCYLQLPHSTHISNNGTCKSIMRPGNGGCLDYYNSGTRTRLLDELFSD